MGDDIKQWLEQEYEGFERQFFSSLKFWRAPVEMLKGTHLRLNKWSSCRFSVSRTTI
jgi:hypothetical protein